MSEENVEVVRAHFEAFRRGDPSGALSHFDPHVVWDPTRVGGVDVPVAYGHEGVTQMVRHYIGAFEEYEYQAERLTDLGSGAVLALVTEAGRGKGSGVPVRRSFAVLYTVIDRKIARVTFFPSEERALEAVGLQEWAMSQENVDVLRASIEAFNRGDFEGVLRCLDPEVRFEHRLAALQGSFVGIDGVRGWLADLFEHFATGQVHCPDIRDLGDRVLALGTVRAVGRESGVETELPYTVVARFRDGLITEFTDFGDRDKALEAAGLSE